MVGAQGGAGSAYGPEPMGREHHAAVPPMTAAPPGLVLSGELRAHAFQNTGQEEGFRAGELRVMDPEDL
eukprot:1561704-Alexandrium_andersonii.AAC.1